MESGDNAKMSAHQLRAANDCSAQLLENVLEAMGRAVELRDPYTAGHERRVAQLAGAIASHLGLSAEALAGLRLAALAHDVGKVVVPTEILSKPAALTPHEFDVVREHPRVGFEILSPVGFDRPVADIVLQHHERVDGSGYPDGVASSDTLLEARILAVADVLEAMASHRPYRPALGVPAALDEIRAGAGTLYDRRVVEACVAAIELGFTFD